MAEDGKNDIKHFEYIDALRGIAILLVILVHTGQKIIGLPQWGKSITDAGQFGVQLFFIVSAMTLFMSYEQREKKDGKNTRKFFFIRRIFRILPLFYVALAFFSVLYAFQGIKVKVSDIILSATFLNNFDMFGASINKVPGGGWSIAIEMMFYLFLPFLFKKIKSVKKSLAIFGFFAVASVILRIFMHNLLFAKIGPRLFDMEAGYLYFWFPNQLPIFLLGVACYFFIKSGKSIRKEEGIFLLALMPMIVMLKQILLSGFWWLKGSDHLFFGIIFAILVFVMSQMKLKLLENNFTIFTGKVSYSLYFFHGVSFLFFSKPINALLPPWLALAVLYALSVGMGLVIAYISYKLIEEKGIKMGKKYIAASEPEGAI